MFIDLKEIEQHPYRLILGLSETELAELQDIMHTVSYLKEQFTEHQAEFASQIDDRISKIWRE